MANSWNAMLGKDVISGQEGTAYITFTPTEKVAAILKSKGYGNIKKGKATTQELFYLKNLEATVEKDVLDVKTLGHRGTQHKAVGWNGSGTMDIYYVTPLFLLFAYMYAKEGVDFYFDIKAENNDPTSAVTQPETDDEDGKVHATSPQVVVLKNCNMNSIPIAKLDVEGQILEQNIPFTFGDFDIEGMDNALSAPADVKVFRQPTSWT